MTLLISLEPPALRRLLREGLRRRLSTERLATIVEEGWGTPLTAPAAQKLIARLLTKGWLVAQGSQWITRLGRS